MIIACGICGLIDDDPSVIEDHVENEHTPDDQPLSEQQVRALGRNLGVINQTKSAEQQRFMFVRSKW